MPESFFIQWSACRPPDCPPHTLSYTRSIESVYSNVRKSLKIPEKND